MMTEKERLHRKEAKRDRRKARLKALTPAQIEDKEAHYYDLIVFGQYQLTRLGEPLVEASRQKEIAENIVEV